MDHYTQIAERLLRSRYAIALTGAGMSVESGIPDFRSRSGFWSRYDPLEYGYIESFRTNPAKVWQMLLEMHRVLEIAQPNSGHRAMAELEQRGILKDVITQNIDSLHQRAGSNRVVEFHGHNRTLRCDRCRNRYAQRDISLETVPPCCSCGYPLRPDIVFFGEGIPEEAMKRAASAVEECDFMMIVGTSATVAPASCLPREAKRRGAFLVEINPGRTELTHKIADLHIAEKAGQALSALVTALVAMEWSQGK